MCAQLALERLPARIVFICDRNLLAERAPEVAPRTIDFAPGCPVPPAGTALVHHIELKTRSVPGKLDPVNSAYVLETINTAVAGCRDGVFDAMVTAPVHKGAIADAGFAFMGHTEYLGQLTGGKPVMMLIGGGLRVALATTHAALKDVPRILTRELLIETLRVLERDFKTRFGIPEPRILVAGLNPHAGESGHLGKEENEVIAPALDLLRSEGMRLIGPLSADTLFTRGDGDCVLAMYHDQGLPVIKYASFGEGVNVTLGLPIIRTSVDHGTALDLAGRGQATSGSLLAAINTACEMAQLSRRTLAQELVKP